MIATEDVQGWKVRRAGPQWLADTREVERLSLLGEDASWERLGGSVGPTGGTDVQAQTP
jgi:hypothetical protein